MTWPGPPRSYREVGGWWRWWPGPGRPSALEWEGGEGEGDMAGSTALVSRGGRVVVVVMRWPGPSAVEREGGGCRGNVVG